jgi:hypothetical protein
MVSFGARREEEPLFRELGLKFTHTEVIASIGTVRYPQGEVLVEAGAAEQAYRGKTYDLPEGAYRVGSDWRSIWIFTVDDRSAPHLTLIIGPGLSFTKCWAFAELVMSGVPRDVVARAADRLLGRGSLKVEQVPRHY